MHAPDAPPPPVHQNSEHGQAIRQAHPRQQVLSGQKLQRGRGQPVRGQPGPGGRREGERAGRWAAEGAHGQLRGTRRAGVRTAGKRGGVQRGEWGRGRVVVSSVVAARPDRHPLHGEG
jgi:hypothetical protein